MNNTTDITAFDIIGCIVGMALGMAMIVAVCQFTEINDKHASTYYQHLENTQ